MVKGKETSGWLVAVFVVEDEWKCIDQGSGAQYVMIAGATVMLLLYADNLDTAQLVSNINYFINICNI